MHTFISSRKESTTELTYTGCNVYLPKPFTAIDCGGGGWDGAVAPGVELQEAKSTLKTKCSPGTCL